MVTLRFGAAAPAVRRPSATLTKAACAALMLLMTAPVWAARLTATTDRSELAVNEHVVLTLSLYDSDTRLRAEGVSPNIDLTLLHPDFHVGAIRDGFRYNAFRNRGRATSELIIELFPQREGSLTIPSFEIDSARSDSIEVRVLPAGDAQSPLVFARAGFEPTHSYERQQVLIFLDVYYRVELESAQLGGNLETEPLALELMEHYRLPNSERKERFSGMEYKVLRSAWALFPKNTDELTLYLPDIWIVTRDGDKRRLPQEKLTLTPQALPSAIGALPVGQLQMTVRNPAPTVKPGQAALWQVELRGPVGALTLPVRLDITYEGEASLFQDRADPRKEETTTGVTYAATYNISALAANAGALSLAPVRLSYFDPTSGETMELTQELGSVLFESDSATPVAGPTDTAPQTADEKPVQSESPWPLLAAIFAILWLATLVSGLAFWLRSRSASAPRESSQIKPVPTAPTRPLLDRLNAALGSRDLESALEALERSDGPQPELRALVREIQGFYFGQVKRGNLAELEKRTAQWEKKLRSKLASRNTTRGWKPEQLFKAPFD